MSETARVCIVDDDRAIRWVLERALAQPDLEVETFERADQAEASIMRQCPDVLITDIRMPGTDGLDLMARVREKYPDLPVIVMTAHSDLDSAVASYQGGAFEYLPKPFDVDEALALVRRAVAHARESKAPAAVPEGLTKEIIGEAPAMQEVFRAIGRL
ncbi:MAG TPA: nitrogen regulation protein NR(I), partial [Cobetia sp.]|nr:nitrogen regulation protein NR(I) [Cobetia sp.]